jgi:hypothetical protein
LTFPFSQEHPSRTDDSFNAFLYENTHQLSRSPLLQLDFPCVRGFALDYMHLVWSSECCCT